MNYLPFAVPFLGVVAILIIARRRHWLPSRKGVSGKTQRWRDMSLGMRALAMIAIAAWAMTIALMLTEGFIETKALSEPNTANIQYHHPHMFKGTLRYLTDGEERVYTAVHPLMFGSWSIGVVLFGILAGLNWQRSERQQRAKQRQRPSER